ncbi:AMP-binding protein [Streptomyces sp. NBC_00121]|uniref:AMP-binding protein n=1 Tax=unclassified Streptomyces TaxID=2593676 RepID=UPI002DDA8E69|nr:AMP-binding protein [Streptomyces sp. NBC_01760]WSC73049.1 AMP-binding protein [Streptomyces sp. NBC_01760]WTE63493.1 AMP-binding protein [Streptomyces sp. NBC_01617]WTI90778.1 AMP-binding protein [Streptomyces sp. NBC_00724]
MLAVDLVRRGAARFAGRTAVHFENRSLTYAEVDEAANRLAHVLAGLGVGRGDRVGLLLGNGLWSISVDFACLKAGAARVPLNGRLSAAEHTRMLQDTGVTLLVYGPELAERALELGAAVPGLGLACLGSSGAAGHLDLPAAMREASPADPMLPAAADDVILILYTSGTTGTLKAAQHTQASYAAISANILSNLVSPGRDDVMLHAASLIHASGTFVLPYWVRGGASVVLGGFDPDEYLTAIARYGVTAVNLVPTMLGMLFADANAERADLARLHTVVYGASPMPRPLIEHALDAWGPKFVQYFGQTEAPLCLTVLDKDDHAEGGELLGAAGHPVVDARLVVTDEDGAPVAPGGIGEVRVKAPFAMAGYYDAPELTAASLTGDGWIRTRDLARFDDRGYLHLVDRSSDMIITGGYNVYPREVEDALASHPAVGQCAVVGAPDATWVEAVTAFVTLRPGAAVSEAALRDHVRARLAGYKVPKNVHFVETIPYSPVGKILRRALRDPLWEGK